MESGTQHGGVVSAATSQRKPRRRASVIRSRKRARNTFGYLLLAPQFIGFTVVGGLALFGVVALSLTHVNVLADTQTFVGLDNYARILSDPDMPTILSNTFFFVGALSVAGTVIALGVAVLLNQRLAGITIFRSAIFIPSLLTMVAWALIWRFIVQPQGALDALVSVTGLGPFPWLRGGWLTLAVFAFIQLTKNLGINVMIFLAALQAVPQDLIEAARIDGANKWRVFRHIVVPQISGAILMVLMLMISGSFKVFELVVLLTNGGPGVQSSVLAFEIYKQAFRLNDFGYASALAVLMFALVLILTGIVWQLRRWLVFHEQE